MKINTLDNLKIDEKAIVKENNSLENIKMRLIDIGLINGTEVKCVLKSPFGDPSAYLIRGAIIAIRKEDAKNILIKALR